MHRNAAIFCRSFTYSFISAMTKSFILLFSTCWSCSVTKWNTGSPTAKCYISEPSGWYFCPARCIAQERFWSTALQCYQSPEVSLVYWKLCFTYVCTMQYCFFGRDIEKFCALIIGCAVITSPAEAIWTLNLWLPYLKILLHLIWY